MKNADQIKKALNDAIKSVKEKPSTGMGSEVMSIDVANNGKCCIADGDANLEIDMGTMWGGGGKTPSPGFYARAALGACLAQSYYIYAAANGLKIDHLNVDLFDEYDMQGGLGIKDDVPRSYTSLRYVVHIESPEPAKDIMRIIESADANDFVRDIFARAIPIEREVRINSK